MIGEIQRLDEDVSLLRVEDGGWRPLTLRLDNGGTLYRLMLDACAGSANEISTTLSSIANQADHGSNQGQRTRAAALLLRDLIGMGWAVRTQDSRIFLRPATSGDGSTKEAIRKQLEFARNDQLLEPATRKFIYSLERPSRHSRHAPITDLIADGRRLEQQLQTVSMLPIEARPKALTNVCQPYLQLVDPNKKDSFTNIGLMEVWRYFRHFWLTRYRSSPGRNLFYLVRDAAQPNHPVMAITALGNTVMQLGPRDNHLGWSVDGIKQMLSSGVVADAELLLAFSNRINDDLRDLFLTDLPFPTDLDDITDLDLDKLDVIVADANAHRIRDLIDHRSTAVERTDPRETDLEEAAKTPLFRSKRAKVARDLLRALRSLKETKSVTHLLQHTDGEWTVNQAIRQLKKRFSATSMMEITVCGGVAPYNHLLGGKLACLMMLSPQIVSDYRARYEGTISVIASKMAGRPIVKDPQLVFLGTSSLFSDRSSQYNRLKIPVNGIAPGTKAIEYLKLGVSEGYGSANLSSETEAALTQLADSSRTYRNVNFVFGEGQSPKMRQLREGLAVLGLGSSDLLRHGSQRILYGVNLIQNCTRFLLGVDTHSEYCLPSDISDTASIAEYWRSRWLASRLDHKPALEAVKISVPLAERLSRFIPVASLKPALTLFSTDNLGSEALKMPDALIEDEKLAFIRLLYRDESAYSDNVKIARLRELHVKTNLEETVKKIVRGGGSVILTGNAGDGKTHTIRLLKNDLEAAKAEVIVDASEVNSSELLQRWAHAHDSGRPFCMAINQGLLVQLIRDNRKEQPWLRTIEEKLLSLVQHIPVDDAEDDIKYRPEVGETVILDLSYRRTLQSELVRSVVDKLTDETWYSSCASCVTGSLCPLQFNRQQLRTKRVQDRLTGLLDRVAERGVRPTFRELLAFVSFMLFGGKTCSDFQNDPLSEHHRYYWNAFEAQGSISETIERGLDPIQQTFPAIDEALWRGAYLSDDFSGNTLLPIMPRDLDELHEREGSRASEYFVALKRRWYFEHSDGRLDRSLQADRLFAELQDSGQSIQMRVGRLVGLINGWWHKADSNQQDALRLWTRLSYSPRARGRSMVTGTEVENLKLGLFKPKLAPALRAAFTDASPDYLLLAPPGNIRFANLTIDRQLILTLLFGGLMDRDKQVERRLIQFNDALAQYAVKAAQVRTIEVLDPDNDRSVRVRVDLQRRRYDSAQ